LISPPKIVSTSPIVFLISLGAFQPCRPVGQGCPGFVHARSVCHERFSIFTIHVLHHGLDRFGRAYNGIGGFRYRRDDSIELVAGYSKDITRVILSGRSAAISSIRTLSPRSARGFSDRFLVFEFFMLFAMADSPYCVEIADRPA